MNQVKNNHIPKATIQRIAVYLQVLEHLEQEGVEVISSDPLAKACDVNASQVRKDLAFFGEFGVRGVGYYVKSLMACIANELGIAKKWNLALVGVGNMGRAILNHSEFKLKGFHIVGAFDCDPFKIGEKVFNLEVMCTKSLKDKVTELNIEMGIIATPPERAQRAADHLINAGIRSILNFAPARIKVPDHVFVEYVDFFHHLYTLTFKLTRAT